MKLNLRYPTPLKGLEVMARVGTADGTVPPWYVRRMVRMLQAAGVNATLDELPGKEHWWWDSHHPNDGAYLLTAQ